MTTFWIVYEVVLTGLMLGAVATWYIYSMQLVQDNAYKTRCAFEGQQGRVTPTHAVYSEKY